MKGYIEIWEPKSHAFKAGIAINYDVSILERPSKRAEQVDSRRSSKLFECPGKVITDGIVDEELSV